MFKHIHIVLGLIIFILSSCAPSSVREAQTVVAQADSMWRAGQPCDDSLQLAQAYETLDRWQWFYADDYAHACYHYGRLLRQIDNPVPAMQVFINATHSRTHDYHILGRVYSNMGSICHLASEYSLAYNMYEHSATMFLQNGDTLFYFYEINDMAHELAEQGKKETAFTLISRIETTDKNPYLYSKTIETKALACLYAQQYDSAVYYAKEMYGQGNTEAAGLMICAQAYSLAGLKDSAVYYAKQVLKDSESLNNRNNALYILTNDDEYKNKADIRYVAADRADVQKLLEIRQGKLSQAVQLLEQDLQRKPNLTWLYAIIATILIIGAFSFFYTHQKRQRRQLLSQQIEDLESKSQATMLQKRNQIEAHCALLAGSANLKDTLCWNDFAQTCTIIDRQFNMLASKLKQLKVLNETEMRLCILVLLGMDRTQIADILPYASNSIGKLKDHTAKLLGTTGRNLRDFLLTKALE